MVFNSRLMIDIIRIELWLAILSSQDESDKRIDSDLAAANM